MERKKVKILYATENILMEKNIQKTAMSHAKRHFKIFDTNFFFHSVKLDQKLSVLSYQLLKLD